MICRPSGLQLGLPKMVFRPWRTSSRSPSPARSVTTSRSGPSSCDRKASCRPSGEGSAWYSIAPRSSGADGARPPVGRDLPELPVAAPLGAEHDPLSVRGVAGHAVVGRVVGQAAGRASRGLHGVQVGPAVHLEVVDELPGAPGPPRGRRAPARADAAPGSHPSSPAAARVRSAARAPRPGAGAGARPVIPRRRLRQPRVPRAWAISVALMKSSRSPSRTRSTLPVSCFVRWSLTIR